jgi:SpoVK/Ycf46/Vps4 family AAA+-type ATPase
MVVLCDIPTMADRIDIVKAVSKDFQVEMDDSSAADLASLFPANVTGADIRAAFVNAQIIANRTKIPILKDLLESCVAEIKASVSQREAAYYDRILAKYRGRGSSSTPSEPEIGTRVMLH